MRFLKNILIFWILIASLYAKANNQKKLDFQISRFLKSENETFKYTVLHKIDTILQSFNKDTILFNWEWLAANCENNEYNRCAGLCYYSLARELRKTGEYYNSYEYYQKSKNKYELVNDKYGLAGVYNGLGSLYKYLKRPEESSLNYLKSAQLFQEINDTEWVGNVYLNLGGMWEEQDSLELAKLYLNKSKKILIDLNHYNLINCYINLGIVFNKEGNKDSAFYFFSESYKRSTIEGDIRDKFNGNYYLGKFLLQQNEIVSAEPFFHDAKLITEDINNMNILSVKDLVDFYRQLSLYYKTIYDFEKAYNYLYESIYYDAKNKIKEGNSELDRNEFRLAEIESERKQKRGDDIIVVTLSTLFLALMLLFFISRSYRHKQKANRLLTEMDELKNRLYSNITHELRTPLTLILGPLEQMLSSETEKIPSRKQVKMMRKNANSILGLVNQMLDLSKIDAKNMKLELVEDDINKFIRTRFAAFASLAEQKSITYNCSLLNEKNIRIFDASKLEKIINNLLSNAIKFTKNKGTINCYANFLHTNTLELIVKDDGKGIPKNELNTIFDRFYQAKTNDEVINIGTGIGLSLTKELVELMHGKIVVESEVGRGSTFTVTLPVGIKHLTSDEFQMIQNLNADKNKKAEISEEVDLAEEGNTTQDSNKENQKLPQILVVEDNIDIREFIAENLNDCFIVEKAGNGKTGLKRAIKNIPDLVITDIVMPKMDGIELCNNLKTDERTSHIPVVMLTGKSSMDDRLTGLDTGADAYLTKPFNVKELRLRVIKLIEQRQKLRERFTRDLRLEPKDIAVTSADEKFIARAMEIIEKNIGNSEFEVRQFQNEMFMSRMQLFRKIKALTNQTPGEFIRTIRLKRAASLLKQNFGNIAQITYEVGFNNPSYFAKCFKDLFGELPSDYIKEQHT